MRCRARLSLVLCFAVLVAVGARARAAEPKHHLSVATERAQAVYCVGEKVRFVVHLQKDGKPVAEAKLSYVLDNDGMEPITKGNVPLSQGAAVIEGSLAKPGFLRCQVTCGLADRKPLSALAAAAIDPEKIPPSMPVPDDFDAFWNAQKQKLAAVPMKPVLTPVKSPAAGIECFDVRVACLGDRPVSGYFARPAGAKPKSLPAVLHVHGAGVRSASLGAAVAGAQKGMLSLDINAHGIPNGEPDAFYGQLAQNELKDYPSRGREDRQQCYFLGMFLRLVRAIDFLCSQPEWDGVVLAVEGHSQGGGQAIAAGGLDPRVTLIAAGVPAICDHTGRAIGRINGWPKLVPSDATGKPDPAALQTSRYFDGMTLATRAKAEAIFSVGLVDTVCPPSSVYAAYNALRGKKRMIIEPLMGHAAPPQIVAAFNQAIEDHARKLKAGK